MHRLLTIALGQTKILGVRSALLDSHHASKPGTLHIPPYELPFIAAPKVAHGAPTRTGYPVKLVLEPSFKPEHR